MILLVSRSCHKLSMKGLHRMLLQIDEDVWRIAVGDDYLDAGIGYVVSGLYFRCHAASAVTALAGKDVLTDVTVVINRWDDAGGRLARVTIVDAIHIT